MIKKYLYVGTLTFILLFQNVNYSEATAFTNQWEENSLAFSATQIGTDLLDAVLSLEKQQEQELLAAEKTKLEQLQLEQALAQEKLKLEQEALLKEQQNVTILNKEITENNFIKYIKDLGYYQKIYKNDEALNVRNAILLFQSNHNMSVTGRWDQATKDMLVKRLSSDNFTYLDTIKKSPTSGRWLVINKTKRTITLYEGTAVMKKYAVAVGNPSSLTASGKFYVVSKLINPDWGGGGFAKPVKGGIPENPLGSRWIGINRTDGSYGVHGTNSLYSIGKYASHGCIRMQNYCVEELFPLIPMKAYVWVGTETELNSWGITQNMFQENLLRKAS